VRTRAESSGTVNDQLLLGLALAAAGVASAATGVLWLATAAFVASIPFLAVGALLTRGAARARHGEAAGSSQ
jgi:hypothetical protein